MHPSLKVWDRGFVGVVALSLLFVDIVVLAKSSFG